MTQAVAIVSIVLAVAAFLMAVTTYLARNRPYIGVEEIRFSTSKMIESYTWMVWEIIVANVGEIPATNVKLDLSYSVPEPQPSSHELGAIFPRQRATIPLEVPPYSFYIPELLGEETVTDDEGRVVRTRSTWGDSIPMTVHCKITYAQPPIFGLHLRNFHTNQPVTITKEGNSYPSKSERADLS